MSQNGAPALKGSVKRVHDALVAAGYPAEIVRFPAGTRSSEAAAAAVGCAVAQIAKSLVFQAPESDRPVLVIASGANQVDLEAVARLLGEPVARADAAFVRARTGFAIGGVAPLGHKEPPLCVIDADLLRYDAIWAAAGAPDAVVRLDPQQLAGMTNGRIGDIKIT